MRAHRIAPIVLLEALGPNLFHPDFDWEAPWEGAAKIARPRFAGVCADNRARDEKPRGSTPLPSQDAAEWETLLGNLRALRSACERHRVAGAFVHGEIYTATPNNMVGDGGRRPA